MPPDMLPPALRACEVGCQRQVFPREESIVIAAGVVAGLIALWVWRRHPWWCDTGGLCFRSRLRRPKRIIGCGIFGNTGILLARANAFFFGAVAALVMPAVVIIEGVSTHDCSENNKIE
jgi:hypothetical protein